MKKIGIITNVERDKGFTYTRLLADSIIKRGGSAMLSDTVAKKAGIGTPSEDEETLINESELIICLGGDGTFLKAARKLYRKDLPILGINTGNLGFLTEVDKNNIDSAVEQVFSGNYCIEERMMLDAVIYKKGRPPIRDIALNDFVIGRGAISRILRIKAYIDDVFVDSFPGDGLIISSPTGSTAYSLSAGGPIIEPDTNLLLITPICPHILYSRSFIAKQDSVVKATVDEDWHHSAMVTPDGQEGYQIKGGDFIEVRRSPYTIKFVKVNPMNFFNILRTKIYFRGESLKKDEV